MPAITPKYPIVAATREQHREMAAIALAAVYANAGPADIARSDYWSDVSSLHGFLATP